MMPAMEKKTGRRRAAFRFKPFSRKQKQLLFWYKAKANADKSMIIADGSIRSGKTIAMICSFDVFNEHIREHRFHRSRQNDLGSKTKCRESNAPNHRCVWLELSL